MEKVKVAGKIVELFDYGSCSPRKGDRVKVVVELVIAELVERVVK